MLFRSDGISRDTNIADSDLSHAAEPNPATAHQPPPEIHSHHHPSSLLPHRRNITFRRIPRPNLRRRIHTNPPITATTAPPLSPPRPTQPAINPRTHPNHPTRQRHHPPQPQLPSLTQYPQRLNQRLNDQVTPARSKLPTTMTHHKITVPPRAHIRPPQTVSIPRTRPLLLAHMRARAQIGRAHV